MKKSVITKTVTEANEAANKAFENQVRSITDSVQAARKSIAQAEVAFNKTVADQGRYISEQVATLKALTPPPTITAEDIFGKELVAVALD